MNTVELLRKLSCDLEYFANEHSMKDMLITCFILEMVCDGIEYGASHPEEVKTKKGDGLRIYGPTGDQL